MKKRTLYILLILGFIIIGLIYHYKVVPDSPEDQALSLGANLAELLGLSFVIIEVFYLSAETERLKKSIENLNSFSDISEAINFTALVKDDIMSSNMSGAKLRIELLKENYLDNIDNSKLEDVNSEYRKNLDFIDSLINNLHYKATLNNTQKQEYIKFLTGFTNHLIGLKKTFKKEIL